MFLHIACIQFPADPELELYKVPYLPLPNLPRGVLLRLLNLHLPESRAEQNSVGVLSLSLPITSWPQHNKNSVQNLASCCFSHIRSGNT